MVDGPNEDRCGEKRQHMNNSDGLTRWQEEDLCFTGYGSYFCKCLHLLHGTE